VLIANHYAPYWFEDQRYFHKFILQTLSPSPKGRMIFVRIFFLFNLTPMNLKLFFFFFLLIYVPNRVVGSDSMERYSQCQQYNMSVLVAWASAGGADRETFSKMVDNARSAKGTLQVVGL
jgi:hypothetical protein